uniref:Uncharacterized protein n=1 Tax=Anopheles quadriannulatus TaxID=34691 RepID=A0A182XSQ0_ANOQN
MSVLSHSVWRQCAAGVLCLCA